MVVFISKVFGAAIGASVVVLPYALAWWVGKVEGVLILMVLDRAAMGAIGAVKNTTRRLKEQEDAKH